MRKKSLLFLVGLLAFSPFIFANEGIGDMAVDFIHGPLTALWGLLNGACSIVGIVLLITAYEKYRRYRRNAMETTISTPIIYLILGILVLLIPLTYHLVGINYFTT